MPDLGQVMLVRRALFSVPRAMLVPGWISLEPVRQYNAYHVIWEPGLPRLGLLLLVNAWGATRGPGPQLLVQLFLQYVFLVMPVLGLTLLALLCLHSVPSVRVGSIPPPLERLWHLCVSLAMQAYGLLADRQHAPTVMLGLGPLSWGLQMLINVERACRGPGRA
jgi:hypothetical protein